MTAIRELIEAVEAGEWPAGMDGAARQVFPYKERVSDDLGNRAVEAFDGSVDAALALMAAVLPDYRARIDVGRRKRAWVISPEMVKVDAYADTPARALLLATLQAMEARG